MSDSKSGGRSAEACPVCGAHQLQLLYFPAIDVSGVQPYSELIGIRDPQPDVPPGIGCGACGTEWVSLEEFRAAQR